MVFLHWAWQTSIDIVTFEMDVESLQFFFETKPDLFLIPRTYVISHYNSGQAPNIANFRPSKA